jgi:hypothetical protein
MVYHSLSNQDDWAIGVAGLEPAIVWRGGLVVVGSGLYYLGVGHVVRVMRSSSTAIGRTRRLVLIPYVISGAAACAAAALYRPHPLAAIRERFRKPMPPMRDCWQQRCPGGRRHRRPHSLRSPEASDGWRPAVSRSSSSPCCWAGAYRSGHFGSGCARGFYMCGQGPARARRQAVSRAVAFIGPWSPAAQHLPQSFDDEVSLVGVHLAPVGKCSRATWGTDLPWATMRCALDDVD